MNPYDPTTRVCPDFLADFSDFVDGTLSLGRRSEIQAHLDCCETCLRHLSAYRRGVEAYRDMPVLEVDRDEFWMGLRIRLASDLPTEAEPPPGSGWRVPTLVGAAVAVLALSVIWVGTRIDSGLQRVAEQAARPDVVAASSPAAETAATVAGPGEIARRGGASRPDGPSVADRVAPARTVQLASASGRRNERVTQDPALQREFEALREEIETAAWLGDPYLAASARTLQPVGLGEVRIQTVDLRSAEAIPVRWSY
jgi:hypothetical protein